MTTGPVEVEPNPIAEGKDLSEERLKFVVTQMAYVGRGILGGAIATRVLAPVAIKAVQAFDTKHYVDAERFWSEENKDATEIAVIKSILNSGAKRIEEWCEEQGHKEVKEGEQPVPCQCVVYQALVMGMSK